ncbi:hypothetical protein V1634_27070 [Plantactinospora veratri]|uniref:DUF3618 domain-containing protein n=1 Tax=Plantactinospora veratri TaxID=1436122 RepID=A0ABU7SKL8_9ACTN
MTGSVGDVVAQLLAVLRSLDAAAVTALRAQADADQAEAHVTEVARGTNHNHIRQAVTASRTASEKAARYARLLAKANENLTTYINKIAPGSTPTHQAAEAAAPSGEQIVADAERRSNAKRNLDSFLGRMTRDVESVQDGAKSGTELTQQVISIFRNPSGPSGSQQAGTGTPTLSAPAPKAKIDVPEAAGHIVVAGLVVGIALHKSGQMIRSQIARFKNRGHKDRTERASPRDSSS